MLIRLIDADTADLGHVWQHLHQHSYHNVNKQMLGSRLQQGRAGGGEGRKEGYQKRRRGRQLDHITKRNAKNVGDLADGAGQVARF